MNDPIEKPWPDPPKIFCCDQECKKVESFEFMAKCSICHKYFGLQFHSAKSEHTKKVKEYLRGVSEGLEFFKMNSID